MRVGVEEDLAERGHRVVRLRLEQRLRLGVAQHPAQDRLVRRVEVEVVLGDERPDEREAVRVEAGRGEADDGVARLRRRPVEEPVALPDPDAEPREVELVGDP